MLWSIIGGLVIVIVGGFYFFKPNLLWKLTEKWKSYDADQPSDLYLLSIKLIGIVFVILGIAMMILPFILE